MFVFLIYIYICDYIYIYIRSIQRFSFFCRSGPRYGRERSREALNKWIALSNVLTLIPHVPGSPRHSVGHARSYFSLETPSGSGPAGDGVDRRVRPACRVRAPKMPKKKGRKPWRLQMIQDSRFTFQDPNPPKFQIMISYWPSKWSRCLWCCFDELLRNDRRSFVYGHCGEPPSQWCGACCGRRAGCAGALPGSLGFGGLSPAALAAADRCPSRMVTVW